MEKSHSSLIDRLPYKLNILYEYDDFYILNDENNNRFKLLFLNKNQYLIYLELASKKYIDKSIFEIVDKDIYYLLFQYPINKSETIAAIERLLPILERIFSEYKYSVKLKKEDMKNLNNLYKVLDNKFSYLEMRIREIELSPIKNDLSWIILSKYHIILDAKIYLYDLQTDMFSFIDKSTNVDYGLAFKSIDIDMYKNGLIEPKFELYHCPEASMLARFYLAFDNYNIDDFFSKKISKLDLFNAKCFCFMCIYIYILNVKLDIIADNYNISSFLASTRKISNFLKKYGGYVKK